MKAPEYEITIYEQDVDYDRVHAWVVRVNRPGFPPHASETFKTKAEAEARRRQLRKSLP